MTICSAGICEDGNAIVMVADKKTAIPGLDNLYVNGNGKLHCKGKVGIAITGNGSNTHSIVSSIPVDAEFESAIEIATESYRRDRMQEAENQFLIPVGYTNETFSANGKGQLSEVVYNQLINKINSYDHDAGFIFCGFADGAARLVCLENPGVARIRNELEHMSIGIAGPRSMEYLMTHGYRKEMSLDLAIYSLACSKFYSENTIAIDGQTEIVVMLQDGRFIHLPDAQIDLLRNEYNRLRELQPELTFLRETLNGVRSRG